MGCSKGWEALSIIYVNNKQQMISPGKATAASITELIGGGGGGERQN